MTTAQFTSPFDSDTDANFRAWGSQLSAQFAAVGLTQTADTGQINWTTASISGYPGSVGYEIWRFNDTAQGTTPIFFRIDYGAQSSTQPYLALTVGPGSNGAGVISGATKSNLLYISQAFSNTLGTSYPSWLCYNPALGYLGLAFKVGVSNSGNWVIGFMISRTCDTSGTPTTDGFTTYSSSTVSAIVSCQFQNPGQALRIPSDGSFTDQPVATWPFGLTVSYADGDTQALPVFQLQPAIQVCPNACVVVRAEVPTGSTFSLNIVGVIPRTFVSVSNAFGAPLSSSTSTYSWAMLYQ